MTNPNADAEDVVTCADTAQRFGDDRDDAGRFFDEPLATNQRGRSYSLSVECLHDSIAPPLLTTVSSNRTRSDRVKSTMNRLDKHDLPKRRIAARLRRMGLTVRTVPTATPYDLLVNRDQRVTLRVAFPGLRRHRVTVAGRTYQYRYRTWHFNFHHHGKLKERYTDYFICLGINPGQRGKVDTFIIPWDKVTGKTFSLHGGRGPYGGRYAAYRDAWHLLSPSSHRAHSLRRVA